MNNKQKDISDMSQIKKSNLPEDEVINYTFKNFTGNAVIITGLILIGIPFFNDDFNIISILGIIVLILIILFSVLSIFKKKKSWNSFFLNNQILILGLIFGGLLILFSTLITNYNL